MKTNSALIYAVIIVIAAISVLGTVAQLISPIDTSGLHPTLAFIVEGAKYILIVTPIALFLGFGRNIAGYAINWIRAKKAKEPTIEYQLSSLTQTLVTFEGITVVVTPLITLFVAAIFRQYWPELLPQATLATGALWGLIDMFISELKRALTEANKPLITALTTQTKVTTTAGAL